MARRTLADRLRAGVAGFARGALDGLDAAAPPPVALPIPLRSPAGTPPPAPILEEPRQRDVTQNELQPAAGGPWSVDFHPNAGYKWDVERVVVSIPGWQSGIVFARIFVDGSLRAVSSHGQEDVWSGGIIPLRETQTLTVTWEPRSSAQPLVDRPTQGIATVTVTEAPV